MLSKFCIPFSKSKCLNRGCSIGVLFTLVVEGNFFSNYKRRLLSNRPILFSLLFTTLGEIGIWFVSTHLALEFTEIFGDS